MAIFMECSSAARSCSGIITARRLVLGLTAMKCDPEPQARDEEMAASEAFKLLHQEWCNRNAEWETAHRVWFDRLEAARARVDRIVYAGKVPVNVEGAKPGNFIEAMPGVDNSIGGRPSDIQTSNSVGRVLSISADRCPIVRVC